MSKTRPKGHRQLNLNDLREGHSSSRDKHQIIKVQFNKKSSIHHLEKFSALQFENSFILPQQQQHRHRHRRELNSL